MLRSESKVRILPAALLLLAACLPNFPSYGSEPADWGIKAGVSVSNQSYHYKTTEIERHFNSYTGLSVDIFGNTLQSDHLSMAGQLSYVQKGCAEELPSAYADPSSPQGYADGGKMIFQNRIDYISVAVLGKIRVDLNAVKPYLFFGPRYDIPFKTKSISTSIYDHLKNNWGLSVGIGAEFRFFWPDRMLVEFQYSPDLDEIYETEALSIRKTSYEVKFGVLF
jgi:hypothetical protein